MKILKALTGGSGKAHRTIPEDADGLAGAKSFESRFKTVAAATDKAKRETLASAERSAARSIKQRAATKTRKKVRSEVLNCRVEPSVKAAFQSLAAANGGKTISDGVAIAIRLLIANGTIDPSELG